MANSETTSGADVSQINPFILENAKRGAHVGTGLQRKDITKIKETNT
jgi:hypothetical protein